MPRDHGPVSPPSLKVQSSYFFGRDDETNELFGCINRDPITLLYGKSGLGKSSLLQAGLFPRLRMGGFLPVYIRLRYEDTAGSLESQVKFALCHAIEESDVAEAELPTSDQSLWEYLHHHGGNLTDSSGKILHPVLVFDQFEEIFMLGESTEPLRRLRDEFLPCLSDLIENTIPHEMGERLAQRERCCAPPCGDVLRCSTQG
jgi:hypothetical protein